MLLNVNSVLRQFFFEFQNNKTSWTAVKLRIFLQLNGSETSTQTCFLQHKTNNLSQLCLFSYKYLFTFLLSLFAPVFVILVSMPSGKNVRGTARVLQNV